MITSIMFKETCNIEVSDKGKFYMSSLWDRREGSRSDGEGEEAQKKVLLSIKDITFIRYKFDKYGADELNFIEKAQKVFEYSTHLVEIHEDLDVDELNNLMGFIQENGHIALFAHVDVTDKEVDTGRVSDDTLEFLEEHLCDRIILDDKSAKLDQMSLHTIVSRLASDLGIARDTIGICDSPLSFGDRVCLTAVKARELSAMYCEKDDVPLPTANHQSMSCCSCIRYYIQDGDVTCPAAKASKAAKVAKAKTEGKPKKKDKAVESIEAIEDFMNKPIENGENKGEGDRKSVV